PSDSGGEYIFATTRVSPWTFEPMRYGLHITPLRAYAHDVPRYYLQDFGDATSHPDTREYAAFMQDSVRVARHLALSFGVRYDLQNFNTAGLQPNPAWPQAGKLPVDRNNVSPRVGFAWSIGESNPLVVRGGYGLFYTRIPQIYNSTVELDNGLKQTHLFLDNLDSYQQRIFPTYPNPLAACGPGMTSCIPPDSAAGYLTSEIAAFSPTFQTPYVQQASLSLEHEVARRLAIGVSYLFVHGEHLIRARDVNLPPPTVVDYPVFDQSGAFTGNYYPVASFSQWQFTRTLTCPFPPCLDPLQRPISGVGAIEQFDSAASSVYHGMTVSVRRRMTNGFYFRLAYTWAHAVDDGQDALVVGRPSLVQNSYAPYLERGPSVTDQRHRIVASWIWEPRIFDRSHPALSRMFNNWKLSNVMTAGSGRPVNARVSGDANQDDNSSNDRLPGVARNSYYGPDYMTSDVRLSRTLSVTERVRLELLAEAFNTFNRANLRVDVSDDGFLNTAATFVPMDTQVNANHYPGYYTTSSSFMVPNSAYAPRQIQFAVKLIF
ncbi:MAG: TonB-dependent receptor, partial [Acidobacteria bacterium]|nr:TonB-dependent receptor [Acidobacteriota bacterium]